MRNYHRAKLTCVQRGVKCSDLGTALLIFMSYGSSSLRGVGRNVWFQPGGVGPAGWTTEMHYRAHLCVDLHRILHRFTFFLFLLSNFLPAVFYSEITMRESSSKEPLDHTTTLDVS